jgi:hypothetical protein
MIGQQSPSGHLSVRTKVWRGYLADGVTAKGIGSVRSSGSYLTGG